MNGLLDLSACFKTLGFASNCFNLASSFASSADSLLYINGAIAFLLSLADQAFSGVEGWFGLGETRTAWKLEP
jgi:hypothetical protein